MGNRFFAITCLLSLSTSIIIPVDALCPTPVPDVYKNIQPGNIRVGFFASWDVYTHDYQVQDMYSIANQLTHIVYAFVKPDSATGTCKLHDEWGDIGANFEFQTAVAGNFRKLQEFKKKFPHIKILLSIGGGKYASEFAQIADKNLLSRLAESCAQIIDSYTYYYDNPDTGKKGSIRFNYAGLFDGIDVDWEWEDAVPQAHAKKYLEFMANLRNLLQKKRKGLLLTADLQVNPNIYRSLPLAHIVKYVDWLHVMAYDFYSPNNDSVGLNAPICSLWSVFSIDGAFNRIINLGVPPYKMVMALPLYGYIFDNSNGFLTKYTKTDTASKAISYSLIQKNFLDDPLFKKQWHPLGKAPSLYNRKEKVFISYDDQASIREKVAFAKMKRLKGIALWKLSGDDQNHTLVKEVFDSW